MNKGVLDNFDRYSCFYLNHISSRRETGPGTVYDILATFKSGDTAAILGKNTNDGLWYKVQLADGTQCWVGDSVVTITGDVSTVAVLSAPATPTAKPKPSWVGTWSAYMTIPHLSQTKNMTVTMVLTGSGQITY